MWFSVVQLDAQDSWEKDKGQGWRPFQRGEYYYTDPHLKVEGRKKKALHMQGLQCARYTLFHGLGITSIVR